MDSSQQASLIARFLERQQGAPARGLELELSPLQGGLEAAGVLLVQARYQDRRGAGPQSRFVLKPHVSSWLQSLGYWEPQARRRHDTLLAGYLSARGLERRPAGPPSRSSPPR